MSAKALLACMAYAHNAAMISQLGREIGRHLEQCKGVLGTLHRWSHAHPGEHSQDETHLAAYYAASKRAPAGLISYNEALEANRAMSACLHCAAAHQLVEDRKVFRQRLGAAKRSIIAADKAHRIEAGLPTARDEVLTLIRQQERIDSLAATAQHGAQPCKTP